MAEEDSDPPINHLPNELLYHIFSYLHLHDLAEAVPLVCRRWRALSYHDYIWHELFHRDIASWTAFSSVRPPKRLPSSSSGTENDPSSASLLTNDLMIDVLHPLYARAQAHTDEEYQVIRASHDRLYSLASSTSSLASASTSCAPAGAASTTASTAALSPPTRDRYRDAASSSATTAASLSKAILRSIRYRTKKGGSGAPTRAVSPPPAATTASIAELERSPTQSFWRQCYLYQYHLNNRGDRHLQSPPGSPPSSPPPAAPPSKERKKKSSSRSSKHAEERLYRILMFGEGLDSSAKRLLYHMMWSKDSPFTISKLYKGVEGMGSGVGFRINDRQFNMAALYKYEDRGLLESLRPQWIQFIQEVDGFIFVVDHQSTEEALTKARRELHSFLPSVQDAPLLILACSGDTSAEDGTPSTTTATTTSTATTTAIGGADDTVPRDALEAPIEHAPPCSPVEMAGRLGMLDKAIHRCWSIHCIRNDGFEGLAQALDWLSYAV